jgi:DNA-binding MarR family transcriptional regulator
MPKSRAHSPLYRLIEAGQLTRKALLVPLLERGLEPGDDALLFMLHDQAGATADVLGAATGLDTDALAARLLRLADRGLVEARAVGPELLAGHVLTPTGQALRDLLAENWDQLEEALLEDLSPRQRKALKKALGRFVDLLELTD